jgi:CRISPR-associated endonuclease Csy4
MNHYIDLTLFCDAEISISFVCNKTYAKLHKALNDLRSDNIGVSFPKYKVKLGNIIRLHGSEPRLVELQATNWLGCLAGYCDTPSIQAVPNDVKYRTVSRIQPTMNLKKLDNRVAYQKANGALQTDKDVKKYEKQYKAKMLATRLDNPYLELQSTSNGNLHRRYIQFGELLENSVSGEFDYFGLSKTATIPWF